MISWLANQGKLHNKWSSRFPGLFAVLTFSSLVQSSTNVLCPVGLQLLGDGVFGVSIQNTSPGGHPDRLTEQSELPLSWSPTLRTASKQGQHQKKSPADNVLPVPAQEVRPADPVLLCSCSVRSPHVWLSGFTKQDSLRLKRTIRAAERITGAKPVPRQSLYTSNVTTEPSHHTHHLSSLPPSERYYRSKYTIHNKTQKHTDTDTHIYIHMYTYIHI